MRNCIFKYVFTHYIIAGLVLGVVLVLSNFAYAAPELPSKCIGTISDYTLVDISLGQISSGSNDFIFAGDNNSIAISGKGGSDCILVGNGNTADISGNGNSDVIILGNTNSGEIKGKGGDDTIIVGENNTGDISGEGGNDILVDGYGSTGVINGGGGIDTIIHVPPSPSAEPLPGTFNSVQNITLSSDGAESIFYTTDNVVLVCNENEGIGVLYEEPIPVLSTGTITTIACAEEEYSSPVASFVYTIELKTDSAGLSSILEAVFVPASGASLSLTQSLTVSQDLEINTTASGSKIILDQDTVITRADEQEFDAATLTSSEADIGLLAGLTQGQVFEGALQWGIPAVTLEFSTPITISIFVGTDLDGQTLNIVRSATGTDGWTNDGIVSPATCVVSGGVCSFQATKASYYATYTETPPAPAPEPVPQSNNSGGGGGGGRGIGEYINGPLAVASQNSAPVETVPEISSAPPAPVVKIALAQKPNAVVVKNIPKAAVSDKEIKNSETAIIATAVPRKASKSFVLSIFASVGRLFSYPFSFWK